MHSCCFWFILTFHSITGHFRFVKICALTCYSIKYDTRNQFWQSNAVTTVCHWKRYFHSGCGLGWNDYPCNTGDSNADPRWGYWNLTWLTVCPLRLRVRSLNLHSASLMLSQRHPLQGKQNRWSFDTSNQMAHPVENSITVRWGEDVGLSEQPARVSKLPIIKTALRVRGLICDSGGSKWFDFIKQDRDYLIPHLGYLPHFPPDFCFFFFLLQARGFGGCPKA